MTISKLTASAGAIALALLMSPAMANAESTSAAMEKFGLIGTWAEDCAKDKGGGRATYRVPLIGTPQIKGPGDEAAEIISAVRVTEEKIKVTLSLLKGAAASSAVQQPPPIEVVFTKVGNKIRIYSQTMPWCGTAGVEPCGIRGGRYFGGPLGVPKGELGSETPFLEKCLN